MRHANTTDHIRARTHTQTQAITCTAHMQNNQLELQKTRYDLLLTIHTGIIISSDSFSSWTTIELHTHTRTQESETELNTKRK